jgi:hypothetical protein
LLRRSSLTVVHRTSVVLDALAAHCPVVVAAHPNSTGTAADDLPQLNLPVALGMQELAKVVAPLMDGQHRTDYFATRRSSMGRSMGPRDGSAAARVALLCAP